MDQENDKWTKKMTSGTRKWEVDQENDKWTKKMTSELKKWQVDQENDKWTKKMTSGPRKWQVEQENDKWTKNNMSANIVYKTNRKTYVLALREWLWFNGKWEIFFSYIMTKTSYILWDDVLFALELHV